MRILLLVGAALLCAALSTTACADEQGPDAAELKSNVRVWEGYLWRNREGVLEIGWPVIAMGVMSQPDHVIAEPLAKKLEPLVSKIAESYVFWNYRLEEPIEKALPKLPRILVRVQGEIETEGDDSRIFGGNRKLVNGRLLTAEFVSDEWLNHWGVVYREVESPFRIRERPPGDPVEQIRSVAPKILTGLRKMKDCAGPSEAQRKQIASIDEDAKVVEWFRHRTEWDIQRWLIDVNAKHKLGLEDLDTLGELPPTSAVLQRWFLDAESLADLVKKLKAEWGGALGSLRIPHYVKDGDRTRWTIASADEIAAWTEAQFQQRRKTSLEMLVK